MIISLMKSGLRSGILARDKIGETSSPLTTQNVCTASVDHVQPNDTEMSREESALPDESIVVVEDVCFAARARTRLT